MEIIETKITAHEDGLSGVAMLIADATDREIAHEWIELSVVVPRPNDPLLGEVRGEALERARILIDLEIDRIKQTANPSGG